MFAIHESWWVKSNPEGLRFLCRGISDSRLVFLMRLLVLDDSSDRSHHNACKLYIYTCMTMGWVNAHAAVDKAEHWHVC